MKICFYLPFISHKFFLFVSVLTEKNFVAKWTLFEMDIRKPRVLPERITVFTKKLS